VIIKFHSIGFYDWAIIFAASVIVLIAVARINDIKCSQNSKRWWARRIGLLMVFTSMTMLIAGYFTIVDPNWHELQRGLMIFGFMISWVTTPHQPPFWKYISARDERKVPCDCN